MMNVEIVPITIHFTTRNNSRRRSALVNPGATHTRRLECRRVSQTRAQPPRKPSHDDHIKLFANNETVR